MSSMKSEVVHLKVPIFSGKKEDWDHWSERFLSRAKSLGFKSVMTNPSVIIPKTGQEFFTDEEKLIVELNDLGYGELISAIDPTKTAGKVAFNLVRKSKTLEYADGNV